MKTNITEVINKLEEMYNDNIVLAKNIKSMAKELETIENDATPATVNGVTIDYTTFSKLINLLSMLKDIPEAMDMYNKLTTIGNMHADDIHEDIHHTTKKNYNDWYGNLYMNSPEQKQKQSDVQTDGFKCNDMCQHAGRCNRNTNAKYKNINKTNFGTSHKHVQKDNEAKLNEDSLADFLDRLYRNLHANL